MRLLPVILMLSMFLLLNIWSWFYDEVLCASLLVDGENHAGCLDNCFLAFICVCVFVSVPAAFLLGVMVDLGFGHFLVILTLK